MSILVPFLPWMESNCSCNSETLWKREYFRMALRLASESSVTTRACDAGVKGNVLSHWDIRLQSICIDCMHMHAKQIHASYFFCMYIVYAYSLLVYNLYAKSTCTCMQNKCMHHIFSLNLLLCIWPPQIFKRFKILVKLFISSWNVVKISHLWSRMCMESFDTWMCFEQVVHKLLGLLCWGLIDSPIDPILVSMQLTL